MRATPLPHDRFITITIAALPFLSPTMSYLGAIANQLSRVLRQLHQRVLSPEPALPALPPAATPFQEDSLTVPTLQPRPFDAPLRAIVHGLECPLGATCAQRMQTDGSPALAGVAVGHAGSRLADLPAFDLIVQAREAMGEIDLCLIATAPFDVLDAGLEAIAAGIRQLIILTPGVPTLDMLQLLRKAETTNTRILGADSRGILIPDRAHWGTYNSQFYRPGSIGLVSSVGCLTDEVAIALGSSGLGQSLVVSLGTEAIQASSFEPWLEVLDRDPATTAAVLLARADRGEFDALADYIANDLDKPVIVYLAGQATHNCRAQLTALKEAGAILVKEVSAIPEAVAARST